MTHCYLCNQHSYTPQLTDAGELFISALVEDMSPMSLPVKRSPLFHSYTMAAAIYTPCYHHHQQQQQQLNSVFCEWASVSPVISSACVDPEGTAINSLRTSARWWCIPFRNARAKSEDSQFWRPQKPRKLTGYHSNVFYVSFVIPVHTSTNAETLVKIGPVVVEISGEIGQFLPSHSHPKGCICYPYNLWVHWTDFHHICKECS